MNYIKSYKLFENITENPEEMEVINTLMDILTEISDHGYTIDRYSNNLYVGRLESHNIKSIDDISLYLYLGEQEVIQAILIDIELISDTLLRIVDYLKLSNKYKVMFALRGKKNNSRKLQTGNLPTFVETTGYMDLDDVLNYTDIEWIKLKFIKI